MRKSKIKNTYFKPVLSLLAVAIIFIVTSCDFEDVSTPEPGPDPDPDPPPADTVGTVAPDGILETVTWNIEWYGSLGNGPSDENLQTGNVIKVVDSLKADLYAFEEISNQNDLNKITDLMRGYRGFVADHITYDQRTAFVFNTQTIDSISSGSITEYQNEDDWAGRFPMYFKFNYSFKNTTKEIYAVVIHGKCCPDSESYERRKRAAQSLYNYLTRNKPNANIVFLGDYNDDVDESIYQASTTPYQPFVEDEDEFLVVTKSLSENKQSSTAGYSDTIDHITISNEMKLFYVMDSVERFKPTDDFINHYATTTSDHYPVMATFDMRE